MYTRPILRGTEGQTPPNPPRTSKRWMRKSANTGDGAVPRSRNRSRDIGSGSRSENESGILAMNGCGDRLCRMRQSQPGPRSAGPGTQCRPWLDAPGNGRSPEQRPTTRAVTAAHHGGGRCAPGCVGGYPGASARCTRGGGAQAPRGGRMPRAPHRTRGVDGAFALWSRRARAA